MCRFHRAQHRPAHGNYATTATAATAQRSKLLRPTIDQIMAWSPSFYPDLEHLRAGDHELAAGLNY
jgi:hypothetical protein